MRERCAVSDYAAVHPIVDDRLITGGKVLSAAAALGSPVSALVGAAFFESLSHYSAKKTVALLNDVEVRLRALEATGVLSVNELTEHESFLELLLTACRVAQHTARKEKIERVKCAVLQFTVRRISAPETDSFFHLFDQLTEEHFVVLSALAEHLDAFAPARCMRDLYAIFSRYCTQLSEDAFGHYLSDLKYRRLIRVSSMVEDEEGMVRPQIILAESATDSRATIIISDIALQLLDFTRPSSSIPSACS